MFTSRGPERQRHNSQKEDWESVRLRNGTRSNRKHVESGCQLALFGYPKILKILEDLKEEDIVVPVISVVP